MRTTAWIFAALAVVGVGSATAQQRIDETLRTSATGRVEVHNVAGNVRVAGWDRNEIRITGTLGRGAERLAVSTEGEVTEIRVILPRSGRNVRGSDLEIRLPARKTVSVRTTSADIEVGDVTGEVVAHTTSGEVTVRGRPAGLQARSTSGDVDLEVSTPAAVLANTTSGDVRIRGSVERSITVESVSGDVVVSASTPELRAKSVSGELSLRGVTGRVSASTVSGSTKIAESKIQHGSFESVSGGLRFDSEVQRGGALALQSHSGNIELTLPRGTNAEFEVKTFSGDIRNQFGVQEEQRNRFGPGKELRFTTGQGDALVTVKTFSGTVNLLRR